MRVLHRFYGPILEFAVRRKTWTLAGAAVLLLIAIVAIRLLGLEFLPKLEEGNLWIRATLPSTISLEEGNKYVNQDALRDPQFSRGGERCVAAWPARRRH